MEINKEKERYEEPKAEIIVFEQEDIITSSSILDQVLGTPEDNLWG